MIPLAVEAGMTTDQFWYDDMEYFFIYIKAYQKRISYSAWMYGIYTLKAVQSAIDIAMPYAISIAINGTGGKKREITQYYDTPIDLLNQQTKNRPQEEINDESYHEWMLDVNRMF